MTSGPGSGLSVSDQPGASVLEQAASPFPTAPPVAEQRLINPEGLTRRFDEADRRIRRQVTQQVERGVRITPPVNIDALAAGGYAKAGSRVGYDLQRFSGRNPQGAEMGRGRSSNSGGRGGTRTHATPARAPAPQEGRPGASPTLNAYVAQGRPSVDAVVAGVRGGGMGGQRLLAQARSLSRGV